MASHLWVLAVNTHEYSIIVSESDFIRLMALQPTPALRAEIEQAIVVEEDNIQDDVVRMGSRVRYHDAHTGVEREIVLVFPDDADAARGRISVLTPVGSALLGLRVGQHIDWPFHDGARRRLSVIAVAQDAGRASGNRPAAADAPDVRQA